MNARTAVGSLPSSDFSSAKNYYQEAKRHIIIQTSNISFLSDLIQRVITPAVFRLSRRRTSFISSEYRKFF